MVPITTYYVTLQSMEDTIDDVDRQVWLARFSSFAVAIATWIVLSAPVVVWKYLVRTYSSCHVPARLIAPRCPGKSTRDEAGGSLDQSRRALCPLVRRRSRLEGDRPRAVQGCPRTCQECTIVPSNTDRPILFFCHRC